MRSLEMTTRAHLRLTLATPAGSSLLSPQASILPPPSPPASLPHCRTPQFLNPLSQQPCHRSHTHSITTRPSTVRTIPWPARPPTRRHHQPTRIQRRFMGSSLLLLPCPFPSSPKDATGLHPLLLSCLIPWRRERSLCSSQRTKPSPPA